MTNSTCDKCEWREKCGWRPVIEQNDRCTCWDPAMRKTWLSERESKMETMCDKCGTAMPEEEANNGPEGTSWDGGTLCNDCYAEVEAERTDE